ncbi:hypothetical protein KAR91_61610 [Candidatus Pacearchaeota archaeon]|nr:hypothetical protein [Candidatus Pacearchaeota archaeon]
MNKKAQLFTLVSMMIILLLFLSFEVYSFIQEKDSVKTRVSTMNTFLDSLEKNLERQLYISGFRILFLAQTQITTTGQYVDIEDFFDEAFLNGTVAGNSNNSLLIGVTYSDIINSINEKAAKINTNITLANPIINITQTDPWNVMFTMTTDMTMNDNKGLANWNKKQTIVGTIPIMGLEDPFYIIHSNARVSRKINQTNFEGNYATGSDIANLYEHVENRYYTANPSAPSFLNRMEGSFSSDENGIESFVDLAEFSTQGLSTETKSVVDYIYFSNNNPSYKTIPGMQSWFYMDTDHLEKYNVTAIAI